MTKFIASTFIFVSIFVFSQTFFLTSSARADEAELNRRIDILSEEIEKLKAGEAAGNSTLSTPAVNAPTPGASPATPGTAETEAAAPEKPASPVIMTKYGTQGSAGKVYQASHGVSIGGYGEMIYQTFATTQQNGQPTPTTSSPTDIPSSGTNQDNLDLARAVVYFGYKFNDNFLFNSEMEIEHAQIAGDRPFGEVEEEFAYLDYLITPAFNLRGGAVLVPVGLTNEIHEPTAFFSSRRPDVETLIIPTTWHENGVGFFGELGPITYRAFYLAGLDADRFSPSGGYGEGQEESIFSKTKSSYAVVLRADYTATPGLLAGGSVYTGQADSINDETTTATGNVTGPSIGIHMYEGHVEWKYRGLDFRTLGVITKLDDVANYNLAKGYTGQNALGANMWGAYAQVGFDVLSLSGAHEASLSPFVRWERYDTQDNVPGQSGLANPANLITMCDYGIAYKPIEQLIVKADYQVYMAGDQSGVNQFNSALGYNF